MGTLLQLFTDQQAKRQTLITMTPVNWNNPYWLWRAPSHGGSCRTEVKSALMWRDTKIQTKLNWMFNENAQSSRVCYNSDNGFEVNLPMYTFSVLFPFLITSFSWEKNEKVEWMMSLCICLITPTLPNSDRSRVWSLKETLDCFCKYCITTEDYKWKTTSYQTLVKYSPPWV